MTNPLDSTSALLALGFTSADDDTFTAPSGSRTTLTPIGQFYELRISIDDATITAVMSKSALKVVAP